MNLLCENSEKSPPLKDLAPFDCATWNCGWIYPVKRRLSNRLRNGLTESRRYSKEESRSERYRCDRQLVDMNNRTEPIVMILILPGDVMDGNDISFAI
jgi:hypothetical protein